MGTDYPPRPAVPAPTWESFAALELISDDPTLDALNGPWKGITSPGADPQFLGFVHGDRGDFVPVTAVRIARRA